MTTEQLAALKEIVGRVCQVREGQVTGKHPPSDEVYALEVFRAALDPTTCLELLEEVERLRKALQKLIDYDIECNCEHDSENCCELNNVFCPRCVAARALTRKEDAST